MNSRLRNPVLIAAAVLVAAIGGYFLRGSAPLAKPDKDSKCELKDVKSSGDVVTYKMVCTGEGAMTADAKMVFRSGGYTTDLTMSMKQGGQTTNMKQHIDAKYMGACPK